MTIEIVFAPAGAGALCADILSELPDWFGLSASNRAYAEAAEAGPGWIARHTGEQVGLMLLEDMGLQRSSFA
jgi:hypothetical protein